ncbi:hypothetical protein KJ660_01165, partial [Candidatus Micrarchaeota archaeon]|nr:hypothetical protein [Candidatus Micrarchaeota archaeon]
MVKDRLPRRLKRFARKKEIPKGEEGERVSAALMRGAKEKEEVPHFKLYKRMREKGETRIPSMNKAKTELDKFQEEKGRIPTEKEMDEMAENLFQQIKEGKLKEEEIEEVKETLREKEEIGSYKERALRRRGERREEVKEEKPAV